MISLGLFSFCFHCGAPAPTIRFRFCRAACAGGNFFDSPTGGIEINARPEKERRTRKSPPFPPFFFPNSYRFTRPVRFGFLFFSRIFSTQRRKSLRGRKLT